MNQCSKDLLPPCNGEEPRGVTLVLSLMTANERVPSLPSLPLSLHQSGRGKGKSEERERERERVCGVARTSDGGRVCEGSGE